MSANGQYQVAILDAIGGLDAILKGTLERKVSELDLDPADLRFLDRSTISDLDQQMPRIGILFSDDSKGQGYASEVSVLGENSAVVVPVVHSTDNFTSKVPESLWPINALQLNPADTELEDVAALVLEVFGLLRNRRRLFISYKRTESANAAMQLHGRLDARSFDVFLDTLSVRPADVFQETLWHRMADSDIVLLLYTESVLASGWVAQELQRATGMGITILQVIWPDVQRDCRCELLEPVYLKKDDFTDSHQTRLKDAKLDELAVLVERLRARALAARESLLVGNLCDLARQCGIESAVQKPRYVDLTCQSGKLVRVIPALGVPDAETIQQSTTLPVTGVPPASVVLLYDAINIAAQWLAHLAWLDQYLPVKTVTTDSLPTWLATLC